MFSSKSIRQARLAPQTSDDIVPVPHRLPACGVVAPSDPGPGFVLSSSTNQVKSILLGGLEPDSG